MRAYNPISWMAMANKIKNEYVAVKSGSEGTPITSADRCKWCVNHVRGPCGYETKLDSRQSGRSFLSGS